MNNIHDSIISLVNLSESYNKTNKLQDKTHLGKVNEIIKLINTNTLPMSLPNIQTTPQTKAIKESPLYNAVYAGNLEDLEFYSLIMQEKRKGKIDFYPLLYIAIEKGNLEILRELIKHTDKNPTDDSKVLLAAILTKNIAIIRLLIEKNFIPNTNHLNKAIDINDEDIVMELIREKHNRHILNESYEDNGYYPLNLAIIKKNYNIIGYLIGAGADKNHIDKYGFSPLLTAINEGNADMIMKLIIWGVDTNKKYENGVIIRSPLSLAIEKGDLKIILFLIKSGANINEKYKNGVIITSPLSLAIEKGDLIIIKNLIEYGADVDADLSIQPQIDEESKFINEELIKIKDFNEENINNPLSIAIKKINLDIIKILIYSGAKVNPVLLRVAVKKNIMKNILEFKEDYEKTKTDTNLGSSLEKKASPETKKEPSILNKLFGMFQ